MPKKANAAEKIYLEMQQKIVMFEYDSGDLLGEISLAQEFGVSRTPVREALRKLEQDGLIKLTKAGAMIVPMDILWIYNACEARRPLDCQIAVHAAARATKEEIDELLRIGRPFLDDMDKLDIHETCRLDYEVHRQIMKMTKNPVYRMVYDVTHLHFARFLYYCNNNGIAGKESVGPSLAAQIEAIAQGDGQRAAYWAKEHLESHMKNEKIIRKIKTEEAF